MGIKLNGLTESDGEGTPGKALLLMGCPEVPVQMSIVLYIASRLKSGGSQVVVGGTDAALNLAKISDPERHYLGRMINIDRIIADLVEGKRRFEVICCFAHSDAGITYAATVASLISESSTKLYVIVFGRNAEDVADEIEFKCIPIVEKAVHNPLGLKNKIDKVFGWAVSKS